MFDIFRTAFLLLIIAFVPAVIIYLLIIGICKAKNKNIDRYLCQLGCFILIPVIIIPTFIITAIMSGTTVTSVNTYDIICDEEGSCFGINSFNGPACIYDKNGVETKATITPYSKIELSPNENNYFVVEESQYTNKFYDFILGSDYEHKFLLTEDTINSVITSHNKGE